MPDEKGRLFADEVAALIGIQPSDWRARVSRGHAPKASDYIAYAGAMRAVWNPGAIAEYLKARAERLADRAHAGLGLPCDICPGPCTIDV